MEDLAGVKPILALTAIPGFQKSHQWPLAQDKVRHVGEPIVACVAPSRARAEDLAAQVIVDFEELPVLSEMYQALASDTLVHEDWNGNVFLETKVEKELAKPQGSTVTVNRQLRTHRQCMMPIEGRAVLCYWDWPSAWD
jgi:carbon-monoxide dehydrogenase large subunit